MSTNHEPGNPECICEPCIERRMRELDLERAGRDIASRVADYANGSIRHDKYFVAGMACQHRTLQQAFTSMCIGWIRHLASLNEGQYDLRNDASVRFAKAITQTEAWQENDGLPYI